MATKGEAKDDERVPLLRNTKLSQSESISMRASFQGEYDLQWCIFDNLTNGQVTDILEHAKPGTYLVAYDTAADTYTVHIRYKKSYIKHVIKKDGSLFRLQAQKDNEEVSFSSLEEAIKTVAARSKREQVVISPIFCDRQSRDFTLLRSVVAPPEYKQAVKYPDAPKWQLPTVDKPGPIKTTYSDFGSSYSSITQEEIDYKNSLYYRCFHTDPKGSWWKPHKAGYITGVFLVLLWLLIFVTFGWFLLIILLPCYVLMCVCSDNE